MKHSDTPWEIRDTSTNSKFSENWREIFAGNRPIVSAGSYDRNGDTICGVTIGKDDAEFIVCATDCHDELLRCCEMLLRDICADPMAVAYFDLRHIKAAEQVLEKAKEYERRAQETST
jgi:hypothetical protein